MNTHKVSPKDFFIWIGAMVALYGSVVSFITLLFAYVDQAFPDILRMSSYYYQDPFSGAIKFSMAILIVLVPVAIILLQLIRKDIAKDSAKSDLWIRRWALFLTVFLAALSMVVDLITLIYYFLDGDLTTRFFLKVAIVLLVASVVFMHFLADLWGYWNKYPARARSVGIAAGVLVVASIVSGFLIIGTPGSNRLQRFDAQKVTDLQTIQWSIINYYQVKGRLPASLTEAEDPISGSLIPKDPQSSSDYGYRLTTPPYSFELCAEFNSASVGTAGDMTRPAMHTGEDTWDHAIGQTCFERTIDPERYQVYPKSVPSPVR